MSRWTNDFGIFLKAYFGMSIHDAGLSESELDRYRDLTPSEAALTFGESYDLDRIDRGWH